VLTRKNRIFFCIALLAWLYAQSACALNRSDLLSVFVDAATMNPLYQRQVATFQAESQDIPINRAPLLPQLNITSGIARGREGRTGRTPTYLNSNNYGLDLDQTLFNATLFNQLKRAKLSTQAAAMTLLAQQQDLMIRVATAYYGVLRAQMVLKDSREQKQYLYQQYQATKTRYDHGEATVTDLEQSRGAYESMKVELSTAKIDYYTSKQRLNELTGIHYQRIAPLKANFPLIRPKPPRLKQWVNKTIANNFTLKADRLSMQAANAQIQVEKGDYLPNVVASFNYDNKRDFQNAVANNGLATRNENSAAVGVDLNWNLFEGGGTNARVTKAADEFQVATQTFQESYLFYLQQTATSFYGVKEGVTRVRNGRAAVKSNMQALIHAEEGYRAGQETVTDVLQIQSRLFATEKAYASDIFTYLLDILLLKQSAGILNANSIAIQNAWLQH